MTNTILIKKVRNGSTVFINAKNKYKVSTTNGMKIMETYIVIGHELIHVLRNMHGNRKSVELRGFINKLDDYQEELEVSGIDYYQLNGKYIKSFIMANFGKFIKN